MEFLQFLGGFLIAALVIAALVALYFLPTIIAYVQRVPNFGSVFIVNLFLGWTFVGWVVALAMAARDRPTPPPGSRPRRPRPRTPRPNPGSGS